MHSKNGCLSITILNTSNKQKNRPSRFLKGRFLNFVGAGLEPAPTKSLRQNKIRRRQIHQTR